ncbi:MAG: hypothetical protein HZC22_10360 [Rhodocyclales bacterium]|nr:hypothetical protein [Rhodocyclales bacterium]
MAFTGKKKSSELTVLLDTLHRIRDQLIDENRAHLGSLAERMRAVEQEFAKVAEHVDGIDARLRTLEVAMRVDVKVPA